MQRNDLSDALAQFHIEQFVEQLTAAAYAPLWIRQYVQATAHLERWLKARSIAWQQLTDSILSTFASHRCRCPDADGRGQKLSRRYVRRVHRFVEHLRAQGLVPASRPVTPPIPEVLTGFQEWLRRHRGLAVRTITRYQLLVAKMLPVLGEDPATYNAALIPRWTGENRPFRRRVKPAIFLAVTETSEFYFVASSVRKSVWTLVRQLRGPHLSTWA